jgi:hypothetical protein
MSSAIVTRPFFSRRGYLCVGATTVVLALAFGGAAWFHTRYDGSPDQTVRLRSFSNAEYPEDPEARSLVFSNYPHQHVRIQQIADTRFRFLLQPASPHATVIELTEVDLAHLVAAVPPWVKADANLTKLGLIDREWNRQQISFHRDSPYVQVHSGGDGFEARAVSRVDLARNCLNAGLWELLLFTVEEGEERVLEHTWFTFPLGLYKQLFERVNGLSYWDYWWSLEHWVDPSGTPVRLTEIRTVIKEWPVTVGTSWDEQPMAHGEQRLKRKNILAGPVHSYRDWYTQPIQFSSFIPPGYYSLAHLRGTQLHYLAELTGARLRKIRLQDSDKSLSELELMFKDNKSHEVTRLVFGGLDLAVLPALLPDDYQKGWQVPMGIGNPSFFEPYEQVLLYPPLHRTFYGFHLDAQDRWIDHHAVGVDGPLLHRDAGNPSLIHLYLLSYERHALLNHFVITCPRDGSGQSAC